MGVKYMAAWAASGILIIASGSALAGADEGDAATKQQLKSSGTEMVPSETLAKPKAAPEPAPVQPVAQPEPQAPAVQQPVAEPMPEPTPSAMPEPMTKTASMSGPYLRVDIGYGLTTDPDGTQSAGPTSAEDSGNFGVFGGGAGYRFNKYLRADMSMAYRPETSIDSTSAAGNSNASEVDALSVMANVYVDTGQFGMLTPYVGAGIGYARLSTGTLTTTGGNASETGETADNVAYALMAGGAFHLSDEIALDIGYRFISLGEMVQSGQFSDGTTGQATEFDELLVHEVKAGIRIQF